MPDFHKIKARITKLGDSHVWIDGVKLKSVTEVKVSASAEQLPIKHITITLGTDQLELEGD